MYSALPAGNTFVTTEPKPTLASYPRTRPEWLHGAEYVHVKTGENYEWREGDIDPTRFRLEAEVMCRCGSVIRVTSFDRHYTSTGCPYSRFNTAYKGLSAQALARTVGFEIAELKKADPSSRSTRSIYRLQGFRSRTPSPMRQGQRTPRSRTPVNAHNARGGAVRDPIAAREQQQLSSTYWNPAPTEQQRSYSNEQLSSQRQPPFPQQQYSIQPPYKGNLYQMYQQPRTQTPFQQQHSRVTPQQYARTFTGPSNTGYGSQQQQPQYQQQYQPTQQQPQQQHQQQQYTRTIPGQGNSGYGVQQQQQQQQAPGMYGAPGPSGQYPGPYGYGGNYQGGYSSSSGSGYRR